jgi:hypothetical protein
MARVITARLVRSFHSRTIAIPVGIIILLVVIVSGPV